MPTISQEWILPGSRPALPVPFWAFTKSFCGFDLLTLGSESNPCAAGNLQQVPRHRRAPELLLGKMRPDFFAAPGEKMGSFYGVSEETESDCLRSCFAVFPETRPFRSSMFYLLPTFTFLRFARRFSKH